MVNGVNDDTRSKWFPAIIAVVGAAIGSSGGLALVFNTDAGKDFRPDPFTGAEGASLTTRVGHLETELSEHLNNLPADINQFDRRIAVLESQYLLILQNQGRILDRLDKL